MLENTIISFGSAAALQDMCIVDAEGGAPPVDEKTFSVRMVNSHGLREAASVLIKRMYSRRGYKVSDGGQGEAPPAEPNRMTLVTDTGGQTVATMTLCFDAEAGLPADENFKDKLDGLRAQGCLLCEPSRLAIDTHVPKRVFASMIHISYIYAHNIHGYTDYVIEVNPRHANFYRRMLGFSEIGPERMCTRVNAPAVLLRLRLDYMRQQIERYGGQMEQSKDRTYYPYFFSRLDEPGITERLIGKPN